MERLLQQILDVLAVIAYSLGGGEQLTSGSTVDVPVPTVQPIQVLSPDKRRTKIVLQNTDAATRVRFGYSASEISPTRGFVLLNSLGSYIDDAPRCHKGELWLIAEAAGGPVVVVGQEVRT